MSKSKNTFRLSFVILFVAAAIVYFTTDNPALCALISGVYSGWNSAASGLWLLRTDPIKSRARIGFAFHLSTAIWLGAPAALLSILALVIAEKQFGQPVDFAHVRSTLISLIAAIILSSITGLAAALAAAMYRVKLWVHPRLKTVFARDLAAEQAPVSFFNFGIFVLATSVAFPVLVVGSLFLINPKQPPVAWTVPFLTLGCPVVALLIYGWFASRIFSQRPRDYWLHGLDPPNFS